MFCPEFSVNPLIQYNVYSNTHRNADLFSDPFFVVSPKYKDEDGGRSRTPVKKRKITFGTPAPVSLKAQKPQTQVVGVSVLHDGIVFAHMLLLVSIAQ